MISSNLPEPVGGTSVPASPSGHGLAPGLAPIVHPAVELFFGGSPRDACWRQLPIRVTERLKQHAGEVFYWWAAETDSGIEAAVLGDQALALSAPTTNSSGGPAHRVRPIRFVPGSMKSKRFGMYHPAQAIIGMGGATGTVPERPAVRVATVVEQIMGYLPPAAQELLQAPFLGIIDSQLFFSDGFYERSTAAGFIDIHFGCYLAGARDVTMAAGALIAPAETPNDVSLSSAEIRRGSVLPSSR